MAWVYFTDYLDGTRPITRDERDELFTQLDARLGDCSANYSLDAATLAAVTASRLLTDRTSLVDDGDLVVTMGRLEAVFAATAAAFSNAASARAAALASESITADDLAAILAANLDDHRLWNYYLRYIKAIDCCPTVAVLVQTRGASSARYGYPGFVTAANRYRMTVSRGWGFYAPGISTELALNAVECGYLPLNAGLYGTNSSKIYSGGCVDGANLPANPACLADEAADCGDGFVSFDGDGNIVNDWSALADIINHGAADEFFPRGTEVLLNLITLDAFLAEVRAAARAETWADDSAARSHATKTGNVTSYAVGLARMRFKFSIPASGEYRVNWDVIWTPRTWNGSAWIDGTPELYESAEWNWDGEEPAGYDPEDSDTWPVSPWFELPEPTADGAFTVTNVVGSCAAPATAVAPAAVGGYAS